MFTAAREDIYQEYGLEIVVARHEGRQARPRRWVEADYWRQRLGRTGVKRAVRYFGDWEHLDQRRCEGDGPSDRAEQAERVAVVTEALDRLPAREREILRLYYFEGVQMAEIGQKFGVTECRISQLVAGACKRLLEQSGAALRCVLVLVAALIAVEAQAACPEQEGSIVATGGRLDVCAVESADSIIIEYDGHQYPPIAGPFVAGVTAAIGPLDICSQVTLRVASVNAAGPGRFSDPIAATFPPCLVPRLYNGRTLP